MPYTIRPYQHESVDAALGELYTHGRRSTLLVLATGLGKNVIAAELFNAWPTTGGGPGWKLFVAHRRKLIEQSYATFVNHCSGQYLVQKEMGEDWADRGPGRGLGGDDPRPRLIVASKDSLKQPHRYRGFPRDLFDGIVVDEGHHYVEDNDSYQVWMNYLHAAKRVLLSASPVRADGKGLPAESVAYRYPIRPAVEDGWLVPLVTKQVLVSGYDLSKVKKLRGDLDPAQLDEILRVEKVLHGMAEPLVDMMFTGGHRRRAVAFCNSVRHAQRLADVINRHLADKGHFGEAAAAWGEMDTAHGAGHQDRTLAAFHRGDVLALCTAELLNEGWDEDRVRIVAHCAPTTSGQKYLQRTGRGVRPLDEIRDALGRAPDAAGRRAVIRKSEKPSLLVLDFVGDAGKHKLQGAVELLAGDVPEEAVDMAAEAVRNMDGVADVLAEIRKAAEAYERMREREMALLKKAVINVTYDTKPVDAFDPNDRGHVKGACHIPETELATADQVAFLVKCGWEAYKARGLNRRKAAGICRDIRKRRDKGPATGPQKAKLRQHGLDPNVTFGKARELLDALAKNGWKVPEGGPGGG